MRATLCSSRRSPGAPTRLSVSTKTQPSFLACRTLPLLFFPSRQRVGLPVQCTRSNNLSSHRSAIRCLPWRGGLHRNPFIRWLPQSRECPPLSSPIGQRFTAKTDADGSFTFSGLPPATHQIQFETTPGYVVDWAPHSGAYWRTGEGIIPANPHELVVSPNACRDASYDALPKGRISGVATSPRGKLPEPIRIRIWPANHVDAIENSWWTRYETSPTGAFQIGPPLPGPYVIATYLLPADFKERSRDVNYVLSVVPQPWFYPGTTDPARAKPITVGFAQQVSGIHFLVPPAPVKVSQKHKASPTTGTKWELHRSQKTPSTPGKQRSRQCGIRRTLSHSVQAEAHEKEYT
jgi:hypothetical protein